MSMKEWREERKIKRTWEALDKEEDGFKIKAQLFYQMLINDSSKAKSAQRHWGIQIKIQVWDMTLLPFFCNWNLHEKTGNIEIILET